MLANCQIQAAPTVNDNPESTSVEYGSDVTFTGGGTGAGTLYYQWFYGTTMVENGNGIEGATSPTLTISDVTFSRAGPYKLRITEDNESVMTTEAILTVEKRPGGLSKDRPQPTFNGGNDEVSAIHMYPDGSYLVGGGFTEVRVDGGTPQPRGRLARFLADGTLDPNFTPSFNNNVRAIAVNAAGQIFVGGDFTSVTIGGVTTQLGRVARFTSSGVLDTTFNTATTGPQLGSVNALAPLGNGSVYVGGDFENVGGVTTADVRAVVRLGNTGVRDTGFKSKINDNGEVFALMLRGTKLLIGASNNAWGTFGAGVGVFLVSSNGNLDPAFASAGLGKSGLHFNELKDGSIFAGQNAPGVYGQRYHATNGTQLGFTPNPGQLVYASVQQEDGKLIIGGLFNTSFGTFLGFTNHLYRAAVDGTVDSSFNIGTGFNNSVKALAIDAQGRIYAGGAFTTYNGQPRNRFVILGGGAFESKNGLLPPQTITFAEPADRTFNPAANTFTFTATSSSGLPVTVEVADGDPAIISGNKVTITGAGEVTLTATQAGNDDFAAATPVVHTFTVAKTPQTITFATIGDQSMYRVPFTVSATSSSGRPVTITKQSGPATLDGNTLTLDGTVGEVTLVASLAGDDNYAAAVDVVQSFEALDIPPVPEPQSITFAALADRLVADGDFTLTATASSGLPVEFELLSGPVTLEGATVTPKGASGAVTIRAKQAGNNLWAAAAPVTQSFFMSGNTPVVKTAQTITWVAPASVYLDDETLELTGYCNSGLPLTYTVTDGPGTMTGPTTLRLDAVGTVKITASQAGTAAYLPAKSVAKTIKILVSPAALTMTNLVQTYDGTPRVVGYTGVDEETEVTITYAGSPNPPVKAGKYAIVATAGTVRKTGSLTVNKAPLFVKADDQRKLVGSVNPELTLSYSGFMPGDSKDTIFADPQASPAVKAPTVTTTAKEASPGGLYPIKAAGAVAVNYAFVYVPGTLTVDGFGGQYEALLTGSDTLPCAKLEMTVVNTSKTFSGKVTMARELAALSFKGDLTIDPDDEEVTGSSVFKKGTTEYRLNFTLRLEGVFEANLVVMDGLVEVPLGSTTTGKELLVLLKGQTLSHVGAHTLVLDPGEEINVSADVLPGGYGQATVSIDAKGLMKIAGMLADGTVLTASLAADYDAGYRLFLIPYKRVDSFVAGQISLEDHPTLSGRKYVDYDSEAKFVWKKEPGGNDKSYPLGFGPLNSQFTLDPWLPPVAASRNVTAIPLSQRLGLGVDAKIEVEHSNFDTDGFATLPTEVQLQTTNKVLVTLPALVPANPTKWAVTFTPATGAFKGSFSVSDVVPAPTTANASATKVVKRTVPFTGVLRQPPVTDTDGVIGAGNFQLPPLPADAANKIRGGEILFKLPQGG